MENPSKEQEPAICNIKVNTATCHMKWEIKVKHNSLPSAM
jgi:hypothetical protein